MWDCEFNFIERRAKWLTRENWESDFEALKAAVSEALASVSSASIRGFYRLALRAIDAYSTGVQYGTKESQQKAHKSHRHVEYRPKRQAPKPSTLTALGGGGAEGWPQRSEESPVRMYLSFVFPLFFKFPFLLFSFPSLLLFLSFFGGRLGVGVWGTMTGGVLHCFAV